VNGEQAIRQLLGKPDPRMEQRLRELFPHLNLDDSAQRLRLASYLDRVARDRKDGSR
jgi:hypothetical protein